jgi:two-component system sensor histidine kinase/response regulator
MGGDLRVESELNKGSRFYFTLMKTDQYLSPEKIEISNTKPVSLENLNIIIAEDEPNNYELVRRLLRKTKANLIWAHNGLEAVNIVESDFKEGGCLVLMDIKMPVMNGYEAMKRIKIINSKIPVIAVTAFALKHEEKDFMAKGFDHYLAKPLKPDRLKEVIGEILKR